MMHDIRPTAPAVPDDVQAEISRLRAALALTTALIDAIDAELQRQLGDFMFAARESGIELPGAFRHGLTIPEDLRRRIWEAAHGR